MLFSLPDDYNIVYLPRVDIKKENGVDYRDSLELLNPMHLEASAESGVNATTSDGQICKGCDNPINDKYIFRVLDFSWHEQCLHCSVCSRHLENTCYVKGMHFYCQDDYNKWVLIHGIYIYEIRRTFNLTEEYLIHIKCSIWIIMKSR